MTLQNPIPEQYIFSSRGGDWIFRTNDMNKTARTSLEYILKKNNIVVNENSIKKIDISVVSATSHIVGLKWETRVKVQAQAGGNITRTWIGSDYSIKIDTSVSEAINKALVRILKDKDLLQYLAEKE